MILACTHLSNTTPKSSLARCRQHSYLIDNNKHRLQPTTLKHSNMAHQRTTIVSSSLQLRSAFPLMMSYSLQLSDYINGWLNPLITEKSLAQVGDALRL